MSIEKLQNENLSNFMENGPGLRTSYKSWVVARDRKKKRVLLGGLGSMGCGEMWFTDQPRYADYEGYKNAPDRKSWMFGDRPEKRKGVETGFNRQYAEWVVTFSLPPMRKSLSKNPIICLKRDIATLRKAISHMKDERARKFFSEMTVLLESHLTSDSTHTIERKGKVTVVTTPPQPKG